MFTGIINELGTVVKKTSATLDVKSGGKLIAGLKPGDSVAVNGVCLTVVRVQNKIGFRSDIMPETWDRTSLGLLRKGDKVNLELAMGVSDRLGGHILQGHIDGVAGISSIKQAAGSHIFSFNAPKSITQYLVEKGSVGIDGISLTLISVTKTGFRVGIIPHTLSQTNLKYLKVGSKVNIEVDILAKYVRTYLKTFLKKTL